MRAALQAIDAALDWFFVHLPWGFIVFGAVAIGGLIWTLRAPDKLPPGDYLSAVGAGAGLLSIGHGIRRHGESIGKPHERDRSDVSQ